MSRRKMMGEAIRQQQGIGYGFRLSKNRKTVVYPLLLPLLSWKCTWLRITTTFALAAALSACIYANPKHRFFPLSDKHGRFGVAIRLDVYQDIGKSRVEDLVK